MEFVYNLVAISIRCDDEFGTCVATFGFLECCKNQVSTCGLARGFLESVVFANCEDIYLTYPDKLELFVGWRPFYLISVIVVVLDLRKKVVFSVNICLVF